MAQIVLEPSTNVLVTGATGLIGGEIVRKLGSLDLGRILALIRPRDGVGPEERLRQRLRRSCRYSEPSLANVQAIEGDITSPHWGLSTADLERVTRSVDLIIHNAADTSFAAHRNTHQTNVAGTRNLIELAQRCQRRPLIVFMSTASNSGKAAHVCLAEHEGCRPDNEHFNDYTQSKAVSEMMLHDSGLPVLTLRPTIVLSAGLADPGFARQILWCVPLTRVFKALPIDPASRLDVVDVNFVVEATLRLLAKGDRRYDCYNLSAGLRNAVTVGEAGDAVARHYRRTAALQLVPPEHWKVAQQRLFVRSPLQRKTFRALRHYFPFLNMDVVYDDRRLREELGSQMPPVRPLTEYIGDLLRVIRAKAALEEAAYP